MGRITAYVFCLCVAATPLAAQDGDNNDLREGMDLLSQGSKLLLRGLLDEIEPALRDLEGALVDLNAYHPPEVLPNGDIIIRRKTPRTVPPPGEEDEIEL